MGATSTDKEKVVPLRGKAKGRPCPTCGKPGVAEYRPFCSKRCADVDLGRWLKEDYRVPSDEVADPYEDDA